MTAQLVTFFAFLALLAIVGTCFYCIHLLAQLVDRVEFRAREHTTLMAGHLETLKKVGGHKPGPRGL